MKKNLLALIVIFLGTFCSAAAQWNDDRVVRSVDLYPMVKYMIMPTSGEGPVKSISELPNAVFNYYSDTVNTNFVNRFNTGAAFDSRQKFMILPDMTAMADTLIIMVGLENAEEEQIVNTVIVGSQTDRLVYFIDKNDNYNFTDDGAPLLFSKKEKIQAVTIQPDDTKGEFSYMLYDLALDPEYLSMKGIYLKKEETVLFKEPVLKHKSRLGLYTGFLMGSGKESFTYTNTAALTKEQVASINAVSQFSIGLSYGYQNLNVGVRYAYEAYQIGTTERYTYLEGEQIMTEPNFGQWPRARAMYTAFASYDIRILRNLYISPEYEIFTYNFLKDGTFKNSSADINKNLTFNEIFTNRIGHAFGAKVKFPFTQNILGYVEAKYFKNNFDMNKEFIAEPYDEASVSTKSSTFNFGFGFQFLLINH